MTAFQVSGVFFFTSIKIYMRVDLHMVGCRQFAGGVGVGVFCFHFMADAAKVTAESMNCAACVSRMKGLMSVARCSMRNFRCPKNTGN